MSTSARKKALRQKEQQRQKEMRQLEKLYGSSKLSKSKKSKEFREYNMPEAFVRDTKYYPSVKTTGVINTGKSEPRKYTGTLVKGIATMHKSNAVPVISQQEAEDISKMRRN